MQRFNMETMKTIEEKALAYDEAIGALRSLIAEQAIKHCDRVNIKDITNIFSELKESDDERIRKEIISYLKRRLEMDSSIPAAIGYWIAWLEKQGEQNLANSAKTCKDEQKPAWGEEDEAKLKSILFHIEDVENKDVIDWLKSLKDRVQPKQEWSEEDYNEIETIACHLDNIDNEGMAEVLRNIRDKYYSQPHWKPSEEQMVILNDVIRNAHLSNANEAGLIGLYNDLKKL